MACPYFSDPAIRRRSGQQSPTLNPASCRIAENAGYPYEGTRRQQVLHQDGWHDMHLHARLVTDETPADGLPAKPGRPRAYP